MVSFPMWMALFLIAVPLLPTNSQRPQTDCELDGKNYTDGTLTQDRCLQYKCYNGYWRLWHTKDECSRCDIFSDSTVKMYDDHLINGSSSYTYTFEPSQGSYIFTRAGLAKPSQLGVKIIYEYNQDNQTIIKNILYTETGITVEYVFPGPNNDAKVLVDGEQISLLQNAEMTQFHSSVGTTVYITMQLSGEGISIVGSQGLSVTLGISRGAIYAYSMAMPYLKNNLYGLCDVFTGGLQFDYTMQNGEVTTNTDTFTESWKVPISAGGVGFGHGEQEDISIGRAICLTACGALVEDPPAMALCIAACSS